MFHNIDLTKGKPIKVILLFTIPILIGSLFQQFYNLADSIIVGQFVGTDAFGATSASSTLLNVFIAVMIGVGTGGSIIISQLFGAKSYAKMKLAFTTSLIVLSIITLLMSIIGVIFSKNIMILLKVDPIILKDSYEYLQVIFFGLIPLMIYNVYSGFLRGIGNSRVPLYFLILATLLNVCLDLLFVIVFKMGVKGVAIATVIANFIACVLIVIYTNKKVPLFSLKLSDIKYDAKIVVKIFYAAMPSTLQSLLISTSLLLVQSIFNGFGSDYTSAYGLSGRIDAIVALPMTSIANALATYSAQNKGAGSNKRIVTGFWQSAIVMTTVTALTVGIMILFLNPIISIFIKNDGSQSYMTVVKVTREFIYIMGPFYFVLGMQSMANNTLCGASDLRFPILITMSSMLFRTALAYILLPHIGYFAGIWIFPISWTYGGVILTLRFIKGRWKLKKLIDDPNIKAEA